MQSTLAHSTTTVVQPSGHINSGNAETLKQHLTETVSSQESSSLLVDMSQVESLDSHGLMALVSTLTLAQRMNKQFGLFGISPSVRIVFELTQLDRVFEIFERHPSELEAAAA
ncbi:MAG TPA: STAS domain-containing protein [Coleofasciculaceae cyanobacterium]|jgi:anti-anti-sigma factor